MEIPTKREIGKLHFENRISLAEIGRRYGLPRWKMHEITARYEIKTTYFKKLDAEHVVKLYVDNRFSAPKIAKLLGVGNVSIYAILRNRNVTRNMSEAHLGQKAHNKDKPMTDGQRKHLSSVRIGKYKGKDNPNWRGGNSYLSNNPKRKVFGYRLWIASIRKRDGKCLECGCLTNLHVHHIVPVRDMEDMKLLTDPQNAITLCKKCHMKTVFREKEYEMFYRALLENAVNSGEVQNG